LVVLGLHLLGLLLVLTSIVLAEVWQLRYPQAAKEIVLGGIVAGCMISMLGGVITIAVVIRRLLDRRSPR
jgi:hypothetical protein